MVKVKVDAFILEYLLSEENRRNNVSIYTEGVILYLSSHDIWIADNDNLFKGYSIIPDEKFTAFLKEFYPEVFL